MPPYFALQSTGWEPYIMVGGLTYALVLDTDTGDRVGGD